MSTTYTVKQRTIPPRPKRLRLKVISSKVPKMLSSQARRKNDKSEKVIFTTEWVKRQAGVVQARNPHPKMPNMDKHLNRTSRGTRNKATKPMSFPQSSPVTRRPLIRNATGPREFLADRPPEQRYRVPSTNQRKKPSRALQVRPKTAQVSTTSARKTSGIRPRRNGRGGNTILRTRPATVVPSNRVTKVLKQRHVASTAHSRSPQWMKLNRQFESFFKQKVMLSMADIKENSQCVEKIVPVILKEVQKRDGVFSAKILHSGSYYENLKVSRPCEFDIMLVFDNTRFDRFFDIMCPVRTKDPCVGYARLEFRDHVQEGRKLWGKFLTKDGKYLSPQKIVKRFKVLVCEAVENMAERNQGRRISNEIKQNGPAVTLYNIYGKNIDVDLVLSIEVLGWPSCANSWGDFATHRTWPSKLVVEEIKTMGTFHLVPKPCPAEAMNSKLYWRISFSEVEKKLLRPACAEKKKSYRIAKAIFEACEDDLKPLKSFHLKTVFLHLRSENPRAESGSSHLAENVVNFFERLITHLKNGQLSHFFVKNANLFVGMNQERLKHLARKLQKLNNHLVEAPERIFQCFDPLKTSKSIKD
ncbi:cyclic GMP-AMP synthase-like receptor 1 [Montipora capricornis]|uniref:cyclic GMP-AMP synthase-like receptor 1 n=1 Tax=Montipora capricornis TaxID=246305 RepID=UPI0035F13421